MPSNGSATAGPVGFPGCCVAGAAVGASLLSAAHAAVMATTPSTLARRRVFIVALVD
jgi:hypothetical protein